MNTDEFMAAAREMGYVVEINYVGTSYIADNKADGHYDKDITNGAIGVLTITDPSTGGEIKIADANGNGAIESEELFMNEILEGVSANIDTTQFAKAVAAANAVGTIDESSAVANAIGNDKFEAIIDEYKDRLDEIEEEIDRAEEAKARQEEIDTQKEKQGLKKISASRYSQLVEEEMEKWLDKELGEDATEEERAEYIEEAARHANKVISKKYTV